MSFAVSFSGTTGGGGGWGLGCVSVAVAIPGHKITILR